MEFEMVMEYIRNGKGLEINDIQMAVLQRYKTLYPEREFHFLSLPREPMAREREIAEMKAMYEKYRGGK